MRTYHTAQGALLTALWGPKGGGNPERGDTYNYAYNCFSLLCSRNKYNIAKQLFFNKN